SPFRHLWVTNAYPSAPRLVRASAGCFDPPTHGTRGSRARMDARRPGGARDARSVGSGTACGGGYGEGFGAAFDLEGHRGTRGLRPENTLAAFGKALQIGVTTLELDAGGTKDGVVVVSHERRISSLECQDTGGNQFVGQLIRDLTYAQIQTFDCGTRHPADPTTDPFVGTQQPGPGTHMPKLGQVFELANRYGADDVQLDIETKIDPTVSDTVGYVTFTQNVLGVIEQYGMVQRSFLQSFDWRTLVESKKGAAVAQDGRSQKPTIF